MGLLLKYKFWLIGAAAVAWYMHSKTPKRTGQISSSGQSYFGTVRPVASDGTFVYGTSNAEKQADVVAAINANVYGR